jgi:hypothetical protein
VEPPRVFRGIGPRRAAFRIASIALAYAGACAVFFALGVSVRTQHAFVLLALPFVVLVAARLSSWRRVSVVVSGSELRYEAASASRDFRVALADVETFYFDRALPDAPLVLSLAGGDERICGELSPEARVALARELLELGVNPCRPSSAPSARPGAARRPDRALRS